MNWNFDFVVSVHPKLMVGFCLNITNRYEKKKSEKKGSFIRHTTAPHWRPRRILVSKCHTRTKGIPPKRLGFRRRWTFCKESWPAGSAYHDPKDGRQSARPELSTTHASDRSGTPFPDKFIRTSKEKVFFFWKSSLRAFIWHFPRFSWHCI